MRHLFLKPIISRRLCVLGLLLLASCRGVENSTVGTSNVSDRTYISDFRKDVAIDVSNILAQLDDSNSFTSYDSAHSSDRIPFFKTVSPILNCSNPSSELVIFSYMFEADLHVVVRMTNSTTVKIQLVDMASSDYVKDLTTASISDSTVTTGGITITARDERDIVLSKVGPVNQLHFVRNERLPVQQLANICRVVKD